MNKHCILILCACFISLWLVFSLLQNEKIYENTLGRISATWVNKDGIPRLEQEPFRKLTSENYIQWDAVHYHLIKEYGYDVGKAGSDFIFAFFPLFPFIWHVLSLPPLGIIPLNYLFFAIGLLIFFRLFQQPFSPTGTTSFLLAFSLPTAVVFFLPYTEALFFLFAAIGLYGLIRKKYWIYFMAFFLCALTRPTYTFLALSIIGTEVFFLCYYRDFPQRMKSAFLKLLPLLLGTICVSFIQSAYSGGDFFKFIEVQKYWNHVFSIPRQITDWSHEGFAISSGLFVLIFFPLIAILLWLFIRQLKNRGKATPALPESPLNYTLILSMMYLLGTFLFILFFQGGSFNGLSRYVLCSPFFFVALFYAPTFFRQTTLWHRVAFFSIAALAAIIFIDKIVYSAVWNFSDFGLFVLIAAVGLWLFQEYASRLLYRVLLLLCLFSNIVWTTYLFNMYIANGWIFT